MLKRQIFKYEIPIESYVTVQIPEGAELLCIQPQTEEQKVGLARTVMLWALVTPAHALEQRRIHIFGTGHEVCYDTGRYLNTFQIAGGQLIFHAFVGDKGN